MVWLIFRKNERPKMMAVGLSIDDVYVLLPKMKELMVLYLSAKNPFWPKRARNKRC